MAENPNLDTQNKPKEIKNPFKEGTKQYIIAKMIFAGETNTGEICRQLGVKPGTVYNTNSDLHKLGYAIRKPEPDKPAIFPTTISASIPVAVHQELHPMNTKVISPDEAHKETSNPSETGEGDKNLTGEEKSSQVKQPVIPSASEDIMERTAQRVMQLLRGENRQPPAAAEVEREMLKVVSTKNSATADDDYSRARDDFERIVLVEASPILKKVALNPKVYLWYDYAKSEKGYKGDIGDFVIDAVEDFWRSRGYRIIVTQEKEVLA